MKWFACILGRLGRIVGAVLLLLALAVLTTWTWPSLVVTEANARRLASYLESRGIVLSWKGLNLTAKSQSFFVKSVEVRAERFCLERQSKWVACFDDLDSGLIFHWKPGEKKKFDLKLARIEGNVTRFATSSGDVEIESAGAVWTENNNILLDLAGDLNWNSSAVAEFQTSAKLSSLSDDLGQIDRASGTLRVSVETGQELNAKWEGSATTAAGEFIGKMSGRAVNLGESLAFIDIDNCKLNWTPLRFLTDCSLKLGGYFTHLDKKSDEKRLPLTLHGDVQLSDSQWMGKFKFLPFDVNAVVKMSGGVHSKSKSNHLHLEVGEFQRVVQLLHETPWAIPSPLNALSGKFDFHAEGKVHPGATVIPVTMTSRLKSTKQRLDIDAQGTTTLVQRAGSWQKTLDLDVTLSDVRLELPQVDLGLRHHLRREEKHLSESEIKYSINTKTTKNPVLLLIGGKEEIPVSVSLNSTNEGHHGLIKHVESPISPISPNEYGARKDLPTIYTDAIVHGLVLSFTGSHEEQKVHLISDRLPAVVSSPRIIPEAIVNIDRLLSSAPVDSVDFDRAVGRFNTKVRIGDDTLVNVGLDVKKLNEIGFRKRLGENWNVITYVQSPFDPVGRSLTAFLEWSLAY